MMVIRPEQPEEATAIRHIIQQAFGRLAEATLVDRLRTQGQVIVSLVAERCQHIVGHGLFSPVILESAGQVCRLAGLGPMAVLPALQRQGIGSLLVRHGLEYCRNAGYDGVVVLGHPAYYPRFGFVPANRYGIRCEYVVPDDVFMAIELRPGTLQRCAGTAKYQPAFKEV
jgi:putative acetyltransferase